MYVIWMPGSESLKAERSIMLKGSRRVWEQERISAFDSISDGELITFAAVDYSCVHATVKASDYFYHLGRDSNLGYIPQSWARHCVKSLCEVDKEDVDIPIVFLTFLLDLSCSEYIYCPSLLVKTTQALWYCLIKKMGVLPVQDDLGEDLACNAQKGGPTTVVWWIQLDLSPLTLYRRTIWASFRSWGKQQSSLHTQRNSENSSLSRFTPIRWGQGP